MQQALEALIVAEEFVDRHSEDWYISGQQDLKQIRESITALREVLGNSLKRKCFADYQPNHAIDRACASCPVAAECQTGEQAEQEPVAYTNKEQLGYLKDPRYQEAPMAMWSKSFDKRINVSLYAAPVRTKDLTDEEIAQAVGSPLDEVYLADFRAVIAKFKEKNK